MIHKYSLFFKWATLLTDYAMLNLVLAVSFWMEDSGYSLWGSEIEQYRLNFLILNFTWFYSSSVFNLYKNVINREAIPTLELNFYALAVFLIVPIIIGIVLPNFILSAKFHIRTFLMFSIIIMTFRILFLVLRKTRRRFWVDLKTVAIVGTGLVGRELFRYFQANPHLGVSVAGFFDDKPSLAVLDRTLILGKINDCCDYARNKGISEIFCTLSDNNIDKVRELMMQADNNMTDNNMIRFRLVPDLKSFFHKNVMLELYDQLPVVSTRVEPLENKANEILKRTFDFVFSLAVILLVLSWVAPILAILIKIDSKGPVIFKQLRSGKENKPFYCYKFRSMKVNGECDIIQATKNDSRVTRVGAFLRRTSLDELPQFFNVLKGDMSVVGPRPHMLIHTKEYSRLIDHFMVRHFVAPGITGWAQVMGYRGETKEIESMAKRVEADIWYLENWSLMLDLKIIFLTVLQIIKGSEKAY